MTKDLVRHSYEKAPSQEELTDMINKSDGLDKIILILAGKYTLRAGEIAHFQASWLHIDDRKSEKWKVNHIWIPQFGEECDCDVCMLNEWYTYLKNKERKSKHDKTKIKKSTMWYKEQQDKYYELQGKGKLPKLPVHEWNPKTSSGKRLIPLVFEEYTPFIQDYFTKNKSIGVSRQTIWRRTKMFDDEIYTHALRSSAVQFFVDKGLDEDSLLKVCGWKTAVSSAPYRTRRTEDMIARAKEIVK